LIGVFAVVEILTEEEFLSSKGYGMSSLGDPAMHKLPGLSSGSNPRNILERNYAKKLAMWEEKRQELREEYQRLVSENQIRQPSRVEKLKRTALGHSDNESVKAARRILEKMGESWR
jgi:hypothetical protein